MLCEQVDIIIPVHNSERYLSDCLKSIESQEYGKINVIIINDGSRDGSEKIIKAYMHNSKFTVKYFAFRESKGVSFARNKGMELSSGEFITFVDSDDIILPNHIKTLVYNMSKDTSLSAIQILKKNVSIRSKSKARVLDLSNSFISVLSSKGIEGYVWNKLFRRELLDKYNIKFEKNIVMSEDLLFVCNYILNARGNMKVSSTQSYYYRTNNDSTTRDSSIEKAKIKSQFLVYTSIEKMISNNGLNPRAIKVFYEKYMLFLNYTLYKLDKNDQFCELDSLLKNFESKYLISFFMSGAITNKEKLGYLYRKIKRS
ncbi:glycosyltransferase family A protein [Limosilactobacillus caviae]|uniref:Glycosyltransferase 2-like domain-containing protein n=1 Tax=Limosilactobacillus caviae TaxID=1769424 RepID=A0ABQ2C8D8_9LACO|nr:glycosyltransferase family A protein [Limosilactobacillus caviae]MCD7124513.1 glycosyltransferase family 2 protein [Limosilactobacillus caviae]MRH47261.1 glycosyltransferase [Limosilactobacillus reuteri]GGI64277.1 hypothetical protein GCM10011459_21110 [Limosilactobacillus caviae]